MMPNMVAEKFRKNNKTQLQAIIKERADSDVNTLEAYYRAMIQRPDRTNVLKQTKVPVLFVIGKEDTAAPVKDVLQQAAHPSISAVHLFDEIAHLGMLEAPEASLVVLDQFIRFCAGFL
jgi:pimeloyl-ACP methyl ester carboxylesterase